jgi:hypothetical protein
MLEQRDATAVDSVDQGVPAAPANSWVETCVGLGVAVLLLVDLLTTRSLGIWGGHAELEMGAGCIAVGLLGRPWLRGRRVAANPVESDHAAPSFVVGAPHIDGRLWEKVTAAMRTECAWTRMSPAASGEPGVDLPIQFDPAAHEQRSGAHRNEWEPAPREALALLPPSRRSRRRDRRSHRRHPVSRV